MSPFGLKFSQMILHTETSGKLMYKWSFLFVVLKLDKSTLLPSTFKGMVYVWMRVFVSQYVSNVACVCVD